MATVRGERDRVVRQDRTRERTACTERVLHSDNAVANLYFRLSRKRDKLIKVIHSGGRLRRDADARRVLK